ncbi:MAG: hypothetical protein K5787_06375 [Lentisphaeria bacterium]|nr:hypothetical protein [Victivallales bacterium]MCR4573374.1 hypothetical protein [Lentisphaeria bacterium]
MARPIETTPILTGRSAMRFERLMNHCKYHPTPKRKVNWQKIDEILEEEEKHKQSAFAQETSASGNESSLP